MTEDLNTFQSLPSENLEEAFPNIMKVMITDERCAVCWFKTRPNSSNELQQQKGRSYKKLYMGPSGLLSVNQILRLVTKQTTETIARMNTYQSPHLWLSGKQKPVACYNQQQHFTDYDIIKCNNLIYKWGTIIFRWSSEKSYKNLSITINFFVTTKFKIIMTEYHALRHKINRTVVRPATNMTENGRYS